MTTNVLAVCQGIAANIRSGLAGDVLAGRTFSIAPDSVDPPTAVVVPAPGEFLIYEDTFDGTQVFDIIVKILAGTQDAPSAQTTLMGYMNRTGATSVRAAILSASLAGISFVEVPFAQNIHNVEWAGQLHLGFELVVRAHE